MWTLLQQLWTDPAKFTALCRGLMATVGALFASGHLPPEVYTHIPWWVGLLIMGASQAISAGDKTTATTIKAAVQADAVEKADAAEKAVS